MPSTAKKKISLVVATLGRYEEVRSLLASLVAQTLPADAFELIIVDQNQTIDLQPILVSFEGKLTIRHVKSPTRGLSTNRNIGLKFAEGDIVAFPDDDCTYYPDTLETVLGCFDRHHDTTIFLGAICDRSSGRPIIRNWPSEPRRVSKWNFYLLFSSITIFSREPTLTFDPRLGVGATFGSNEDADYLYRLLCAGRVVRYDPSIQVWHAIGPSSGSSLARVATYGLGFGAFAAKNISFPCAVLLAEAVLYHLAIAARAFFLLDFQAGRAHVIASGARLGGAFRFAFSRVTNRG